LAAEAARKLEASGQPVQGGFYAGAMFVVLKVASVKSAKLMPNLLQ